MNEAKFSCGWCTGENSHTFGCNAPRVDVDEKGEPQFWNLKLNKYQRDNLIWLLKAIGYPYDHSGQSGPVEPFHLANTGDWVGELSNMLTIVDVEARPNRSIQELREQVDHWLIAAKIHLT